MKHVQLHRRVSCLSSSTTYVLKGMRLLLTQQGKPNLVRFSAFETLQSVLNIIEGRSSMNHGHEQAWIEVLGCRHNGATAKKRRV